MNVELLRKVQAHILEEPKRLDMGAWGVHVNEGDGEWEAPTCGTVACIAGWTVALSQGLSGYELEDLSDVSTLASELLGLNGADACALFYAEDWPKRFRDQLNRRNPQTKAYALVVSHRIDHFLSTDGRE